MRYSGWILLFVVSLLLSLLSAFVFSVGMEIGERKALPAPEKEWALPALFEGEGAVTFGCSLWEVPMVNPYGPDNPNEGFFAAQIAGSNEGLREAAIIVDGPNGTTLISGQDCGISIDWRRFPTEERPADRQGN